VFGLIGTDQLGQTNIHVVPKKLHTMVYYCMAWHGWKESLIISD